MAMFLAVSMATRHALPRSRTPGAACMNMACWPSGERGSYILEDNLKAKKRVSHSIIVSTIILMEDTWYCVDVYTTKSPCIEWISDDFLQGLFHIAQTGRNCKSLLPSRC
jgi:hypothetical protein